MASAKKAPESNQPVEPEEVADLTGPRYEQLKELSHDLMVAAEKDDIYQVEKAAAAVRVWFIENEPEFQH